MPPDKICKTVRQYNKEPIAKEDMRRLLDIAEDCRCVKNYVYSRFGGPGSLSKLYPGYTVQNEMTASGYREKLGLPSVYFYLAVFDALGDIKCRWKGTKQKLTVLINRNKNFTEEEKHYLQDYLDEIARIPVCGGRERNSPSTRCSPWRCTRAARG